MNTQNKVSKYLYKDQVGQIPTGTDGKPVPALLFANSRKSNYFGDMYLFANFGIAGGNTLTATSDITTHFVEDNSALQDHWALTPITYTLTGYIGEAIYRPATQWTDWLQDKAIDYLEPLKIISPTVSSYVNSAMNVAHELEATYQKYSKYAENIMRTINNWTQFSEIESNQYQTYQQLKKIRENRILVDIYTPYDTLKNMAITNITMTQDDKTMYKSAISVTLQEYRDVQTLTRKAKSNEVSKLLGQQTANEVNSGYAKTQQAPLESTIYKGLNAGKNFAQIILGQ